MKTVLDIPDIKNKKVLFRADFDVSVSGRDEVQEKFRIEKQKRAIDYLTEQSAKVVIVAHISDPDVGSFGELIPQLHILLKKEIGFIKKIEDIPTYLDNYPGPGLLENIRLFEGEKENDEEFAKKLSAGFDVYINNAFSVCHRAHASVSAITKFLPAYAGSVGEEEIAVLKKAIEAPAKGKIVIIGGAKAETKAPVIKNFINKADIILTGGVVANDILKEKGQGVGSSVVDINSKELLAGLDLNNPKLIVPEDFVIFDDKILDIGEKTIKNYKSKISSAKMIIWNGPMGLFENQTFAVGTDELAGAIADSGAYKIIGGGDTISAVNKAGLLGKFDFVSTGGGAMLLFLAGEELPGLKALEYYNHG